MILIETGCRNTISGLNQPRYISFSNGMAGFKCITSRFGGRRLYHRHARCSLCGARRSRGNGALCFSGRYARLRVSDAFDVRLMVKKIEEVYQGL